MKTFFFTLVLTSFAATSLYAELTVPHFFSDHMVLQRDGQASIRGRAKPGEDVAVTFKGETSTGKVNSEGRWRVEVKTGPADPKGAVLTIASGEETLTIIDVLVGEVWFASGQSNMVFSMNRVPAYEDLIAKANHPLIRMFNAPTVTAIEPQDDIKGEWTAANPKTVGGYSAVAFFFARKLQTELGIPIGVIKSAWGGKPVETFTSREALNSLPGTKVLVDATLSADAVFDLAKASAAYEARLDQWKAAFEARKNIPAAERKKMARKPSPPKRPLDTEGKPGVLFDSMIHPFIGYTIRGAIWYQGEGNAKAGAVPYDQTLPLMINDWRKRWDSDFSFYFVQLANFRDPSTEPGNNDPWPLLQDRMRLVLATTPKTGMAVINDVGDAKDIHPKNKHAVGERLALWALAKDYGKDITYSGPLFQSSKVKDGAIRITFDQVGSGLSSRDGGELNRFEIAGTDKVWHWADAKVDGTAVVIVSSADVPSPVAVRYAWASNPEGANLVNSEGLPASVFRTDDWADVMADSKVTNTRSERRTMATAIKALAAKKKGLDRKSPEFKAIVEKQAALMKKHREMSPTGTPK